MNASALIADVRARLSAAPRERLGEWTSSRKVLGIGRAPRIVPAGEAWHLGVLLIGPDAVAATGEIVRARTEVIRGFTAESQRARAALAAAARRGGFAEGETVHLGWEVLDLDVVDAGGTSGPLSVVVGIPQIRWSAGGGIRPLGDYLDEQVALR
ncbi:glutaminase [uncultured Microbacterium sp.]|uniref:glutaminase n=1 Tax=uncultured Microbacterium sp. TaxID=191216 RepID=UPI00263839F5|nr:glutaminase [uncultured Microbacterium sp.]